MNQFIFAYENFQSACKSYLLRQRIELFVIQTDIDVGKIIELEFNSNRDSKVKQWKSDFLLLIHGFIRS